MSRRLGENSEHEITYGLSLLEYMAETAVGFFDNTISLVKGSTNSTAVLFVEFWWWLHRKADYLIRGHLEAKSWCKELSQGSWSCKLSQDDKCRLLK